MTIITIVGVVVIVGIFAAYFISKARNKNK